VGGCKWLEIGGEKFECLSHWVVRGFEFDAEGWRENQRTCYKDLGAISADKDFLPAAKMVASYGKKVAIFRPLGYADVERPNHHNLECFDITEEDLRRSRLPDRIERDKGSAITWTRYCELKVASKGVPPKIAPPDPAFDRQCQDPLRRCLLLSRLRHGRRPPLTADPRMRR